MEAATMTPAANPARKRDTPSRIFFFKKNTQADPKTVPKNGIISPRNTVQNIVCTPAIRICITFISMLY